jgi:hypothetical protein
MMDENAAYWLNWCGKCQHAFKEKGFSCEPCLKCDPALTPDHSGSYIVDQAPTEHIEKA